MWVEITSHGDGVPSVTMQGAQGFDNRFVVASPGNATRAITVAAFATRRCWPSQVPDGASCYVQQEALGDLARFSGGGPRRDGVIKPEIAAPGIGVMSARSGNAGVGANRADPDGAHSLLEGTSMAAPHVAGTILALYQAKPDLTPEEVRQILMASALTDAFTARVYDAAGAPSDWWGAGKLTGSGPAVLALSTETAVPEGATLSPRGTRLPLLALRLSSQGTEAIDVTSLTFELTGEDPGAHLVLVRDANANGLLDAQDVAVDSVGAALSGGERTVTVSLSPGELRIPALGVATVFAAVSLSGAAPNGTTFSATFVPAETESVGVRTGAANALNVAQTPLASGPATTTVLAQDELLSFSANPVRLDHVVFNFVEAPTTAAVYTLSGRRVIDLVAEGTLSVRWDLRNEDGSRVAPGVYLVVFRVRDQLFREKLVVLTPGAPTP
jgi:subtilisin family serine protease